MNTPGPQGFNRIRSWSVPICKISGAFPLCTEASKISSSYGAQDDFAFCHIVGDGKGELCRSLNKWSDVLGHRFPAVPRQVCSTKDSGGKMHSNQEHVQPYINRSWDVVCFPKISSYNWNLTVAQRMLGCSMLCTV